MRMLLTVTALLLVPQGALGLECYDCIYDWTSIVDKQTGPESECRYGNPKCANSPSESEKGINRTTCADNQVCVTLHLKGVGNTDDTTTEFIGVLRRCVDQIPSTEVCYYTGDIPDDLIPPGFLPDGLEVSEDTEICQCSSNTCNNKKFKSAATTLQLSGLWLLGVVASAIFM